MSFLTLILAFAVNDSPGGRAPGGFRQIRFEGNRGLSAGALKSAIGLRANALYTNDQLRRGIEAIRELYRQQGFLDAWVESRIDTLRGRPTLLVRIREGERARLRRIDINGVRSRPILELTDIANLRENDFLVQGELQSARQNLVDYYRNHGFFYARCSVQVERLQGSSLDTSIRRPPAPPPSVDVLFDITEGPVCYIRELHVRGNVSIKRSLVDRFAEVRPGERYSQTKLAAMQRRLYSSRLFDRAYLTTTNSNPAETSLAAVMARASDSLDLRLDILELPPRSVGFGAGIELLPWRGLLSAEWEHLNVFGEAHTFRISADYSPLLGRDFARDYLLDLNLSYGIPYLTNWAVNLLTQPFAKWQYKLGQYELDYGAETGMSHDFTTSFSAQLTNRLHWVLLSDTIPLGSSQPLSASTNSLGLGVTIDTRDDLFSPRRGVFFRPRVEVAGGLLGGSNSFSRLTTDARWFLRLPAGHVIALRALGGAALPYGRSQTVPFYEEFYLGGVNSLRGYDEKSVGPVAPAADSTHRYGDILLNTNVEVRSPFIKLHNSVVKGLGFVLFLDGGTVFGDGTNYDFGKYQNAAGAGIRVDTPIGPVRLDYGKRLTDPPRGDWGRVYVGILNVF